MRTKSVKNGQAIRTETVNIQLSHDDKKEKETIIDRRFAEPDELQSELYIQRQLNTTVKGQR